MDLKLFTKPGCTPCVPVKRVAEQVQGCSIIDLSVSPEYIEKYNLMATPTLLVDETELITIPNLIIERLQGLI